MKKRNRNIYLFTGFAIFLLAGMIYAWTIFSKSISATFPSWSAQTLSLTFTIMMMTYALGCFCSGVIVNRIGTRKVLLIAVILFPVGLIIASVASVPVVLYIGFGVFSGFSAGLCYNSIISTISAWFPDKQGTASGILLTAFGLSSFIMGKAFAAFAPANGSRAWGTGFRILAVLILVLLLIGAWILHFPEEQMKVSSVKRSKKHDSASDMNTSKMIRTSSFWLYYIWTSFLTAAGLILVSQSGGIAGQVGVTLSENTIATVVGMISIMNAVGRICIGLFFDRFSYRKTMILVMGAFAASALLMIFALETGSFAAIVTGFLFGGFAYGGIAAISPPVIADFFGKTHYSMNFSLIATNALFTSFSSVLAGRMYDMSHSYLGPLFLMLGATAAAAVISLFIRRPKENTSGKMTHRTTISEKPLYKKQEEQAI